MNPKSEPEANAANVREIEHERTIWSRARRAEHLKFIKRFCFHASSTFMDYLHGDVKPEEAPIACVYEYMRESKILRQATERRDELIAKGLDEFNHAQRATWKQASSAERAEKAALRTVEELREHPRFIMEVMSCLACESFPQKDWQELSLAERQPILRLYGRRRTPPLRLADVGTLDALRIFGKFKAMAKAAKPVIEDHDPQRGKFARPYKPVPAILQQHGPFYHVIFTLDLSQTETQLAEQFRAWLKMSEVQRLLMDYKKPLRNPTDEALDRLKDLAAWRLYREHNNDWNAANDFANKHRKQKKPFRDAKRKIEKQANRKTVVIPAHAADLFGSDADPIKAQAAAWEHLIEIMPSEFEPPGAHMLALFVELQKIADKT